MQEILAILLIILVCILFILIFVKDSLPKNLAEIILSTAITVICALLHNWLGVGIWTIATTFSILSFNQRYRE